ncbi:MAG: amino acid ABC transporter permease [Ilumatobacteraceae bacterium]
MAGPGPDTTKRSTGRPPPWRDVRVLAWAFQLAIVAVVFAVVAWLYDNFRVNSNRLNIPIGYDFLGQPSSFPIPASDFRQTQPVRDAIFEGFQNTLRLAVTGLVLATVVGVLLGIARLSKNFIVRTASQVYVEFVRNVPLLAIIVVLYIAVVLNAFPRVDESWDYGPFAILNVRGASMLWIDGSNWSLVALVVVVAAGVWAATRWRHAVNDRTGRPARPAVWGLGAAVVVGAICWLVLGLGLTAPEIDGRRVSGGITMSPEYFAALVALVLYTASHIAEIVRGSIQAVPRGQGEAADALALSGFQRTWHVVLPQAMRIAVPPIGNQYLNLAKNSSLAAVISFPELTKILQLTVANRSPAVPAFALLLAIYLVISLVLSVLVNLANRRLAIVER